MEVNNGATQSVRYFTQGLSPGESTTVREMEQLENELLYARSLQALKQQYIADERYLEVHRREVQRALYGLTINRGLSIGGFGGFGPTNLAYVPDVGGPYGYGYFGGYGGAFLGGATSSVTETLATGVGDEGAIKDALARVIAQQATPQYMAALDREFDRVAMRASASPTLRVALGLPSVGDRMRERRRELDIGRPVNWEKAAIILTLQDGTEVFGSKMRETKDWIILTKLDGGEMRLRPAKVEQIDIRDKSKVVPASD
jgi:hypothetical protein